MYLEHKRANSLCLAVRYDFLESITSQKTASESENGGEGSNALFQELGSAIEACDCNLTEGPTETLYYTTLTFLLNAAIEKSPSDITQGSPACLTLLHRISQV